MQLEETGLGGQGIKHKKKKSEPKPVVLGRVSGGQVNCTRAIGKN